MNLEEIDQNFVGEIVGEKTNETTAPAKKKRNPKKKYKKGKFRYTLQEVETKNLYVRLSFKINKMIKDPKTGVEKFVERKQYWKICEPQTQERVTEIIKELKNDFELAGSNKELPSSNFAEVAEKFIESEFSEAVFRDGKKVSGKIQTRIPKIIVKRLIEFFGHFEISQITYHDLKDYKNFALAQPIKYKFKESKERSVRTVNYDLTILKQIFKFAIQKRWLDRSPFYDGKALINVSEQNKRYKTWTKEEEQAALKQAVGRYVHMKAVIICICDGGFRLNELLSALWSEVDFENKAMLAKNFKGKNLRVRPIFLTNRMKDALLEWQQTQKKWSKADQTLVIGYKDVKKAWNYIRDKIDRKDLTLHDLRHVFATRLNKRKVQIANISQLLGHSQISTTQIYLNPDFEELRHDVGSLEDFED